MEIHVIESIALEGTQDEISRRVGREADEFAAPLTLKRPSLGELFQPRFRQTTIVTTVMMACAYAAAFGAIQQVPRIVPGLPEVATLTKPAQEVIVSSVQFMQEMGGLLGRFILAALAIYLPLMRIPPSVRPRDPKVTRPA